MSYRNGSFSFLIHKLNNGLIFKAFLEYMLHMFSKILTEMSMHQSHLMRNMIIQQLRYFMQRPNKPKILLNTAWSVLLSEKSILVTGCPSNALP